MLLIRGVPKESLKVKKCKKIYHANTNEEKAGATNRL